MFADYNYLPLQPLTSTTTPIVAGYKQLLGVPNMASALLGVVWLVVPTDGVGEGWQYVTRVT